VKTPSGKWIGTSSSSIDKGESDIYQNIQVDKFINSLANCIVEFLKTSYKNIQQNIIITFSLANIISYYSMIDKNIGAQLCSCRPKIVVSLLILLK
jgi:hypothetical protein